MKFSTSALLLVLFCSEISQGQPFAPYAARSEFLLTSPGGATAGLQGYVNPALLTYAEQMETIFTWSDAPDHQSMANQWGLFTGLPHLGFGTIHRELPGKDLNEHRISLSAGDRKTSLGLGYGWASGNTRFLERKNLFVVGFLTRPSSRLSLGFTFTSTLSASGREAALDLALRPLGGERLTLFSDYALANKEAGDDSYWSAGAALELEPGLRLTGRYLDNHTFSFGLQLDLGYLGFHTQSRFDEDRNHTFNTYGLRMGAFERSALKDRFDGEPGYLDLNLFGPVRHRRFALFDSSRTLVGLLALIQRARDDPGIGGLAINTSGLRIDPAMAWELRQQLQDFRSSGKYVIAYVDRADLRSYHFASVADRIVLDPAGMIALEGFVGGQTYVKGALEKLGIGFEEWRFFEYKSAFENLAREDMSAADREQLQVLIDDFYQLAREEICAARDLAPEEFDRLVDEETLFLPPHALEKGLVDQVGRWDQVRQLIKDLEGGQRALIKPEAYPLPRDHTWGERPHIALVYALGVCDMDQGIGARRLVQDIEAVKDDPRIKAVVLRVDSPGGDVLPSDLVAEAVKKCKKKKPVIVSQGRVAASGGYWISMYGDAIVATPNTITGSIGVIGGWLYNQGFKEKLGLSTDHVQVGAHADLGFGMTVPLLGLPLPDRNLSGDERAKMEHTIRALYKNFVDKVAVGRGKTSTAIDSLARGRVWSGRDAAANGLVDQLGGLDTAIQLARKKAGISPGEKIRLLEFPRRPLFSMGFLRPRLLDTEQQRALLEYLQFRLEHNGRPLLLLPLENPGISHLEFQENNHVQ